MPIFEETVHNAPIKEHLAFTVSINRSEVLSLIKQISDRSRELVALSNQLIAAVQVETTSAAEGSSGTGGLA